MIGEVSSEMNQHEFHDVVSKTKEEIPLVSFQ
jgi:hypothetical protein